MEIDLRHIVPERFGCPIHSLKRKKVTGARNKHSQDNWPSWLDSLFCPPATITALTGDSRSGKTSLCLQAVQDARFAGLGVAGVLSPGRYDATGARTGIDLLDPVTGRRWPLGDVGPPDPVTGRIWYLRPETTQRGVDLLASSSGCDLLVVDEIGPDELIKRQGWCNALDVLHARAYQRALVVVRPWLIETFQRQVGTLPIHLLTLPLDC